MDLGLNAAFHLFLKYGVIGIGPCVHTLSMAAWVATMAELSSLNKGLKSWKYLMSSGLLQEKFNDPCPRAKRKCVS